MNVPICLPQTEMRRGSTLHVASFALLSGQRAEIRSLNLSIVRLFTPGVNFSEINKPFGLASLGVFDDDQMACSPIIGVHAHELGTTSLNPSIRHTLMTPAVYRIVVTNNTGLTYDTSLDFAVVVTGCIKIRTNTDPSGAQAASTVTFGVPATVTVATPTSVTSTTTTTTTTTTGGSTTTTTTTTGGSTSSSDGGVGGCPATWQMMLTQEKGWIPADQVQPGMHLTGVLGGWVKVYGSKRTAAPIWRCVVNNVDVFDVDANHAWLMPDNTWKSIQKLKVGDKIKSGGGPLPITALYFLKNAEYVNLAVEGQHYAMNAYYAHNATGSRYSVYKY
jgi:hypothetical protein